MLNSHDVSFLFRIVLVVNFTYFSHAFTHTHTHTFRYCDMTSICFSLSNHFPSNSIESLRNFGLKFAFLLKFMHFTQFWFCFLIVFITQKSNSLWFYSKSFAIDRFSFKIHFALDFLFDVSFYYPISSCYFSPFPRFPPFRRSSILFLHTSNLYSSKK